MQLTIKLIDTPSNEKLAEIIKKIEKTFINEQILITVDKETTQNLDSWDNLDIDHIAVDTGIEDFAKNNGHYLYGLLK